MITLKVTVTGLDAALAEIDRRTATMRENIERALTWFGTTASELMIETHTFQNRTFRLEGSIGYDLYPFVGTEAHVSVFALADYASEVEFGHPGAQPYPFFFPVWFEQLPTLDVHLATGVEQALATGQTVTP